MASAMPKSLTCVSGWGCEGDVGVNVQLCCPLWSRRLFEIAATGDAGISCSENAIGDGRKVGEPMDRNI